MELARQHVKDVWRVLRYNGPRGWAYRPALWETKAWLAKAKECER